MPLVQERARAKRDRLVAAADRVVHRQGYAGTTLADIAREAEQPVGSLYYYFRTKEAVVEAIVAERLRDLESRIARWERRPDPRARLRQLIQVWVDDREIDARYGCPVGSLCYELGKSGAQSTNRAADPLRRILEWSETQFRALGEPPARARDRAAHLLAALQGISLLANAFRDPNMILREARELQRWLEQ